MLAVARSLVAASARMAARRASSTAVTAAQVKKLRQMTDAPILSCKQALSDPEVAGDYDKAVHWLRRHGIAAACGKSGRRTGEGVVVLRRRSDLGTLLEINTETDLVSRDAAFLEFANRLADACLEGLPETVEAILKQSVGGVPVSEAVDALKYRYGENIRISRFRKLPLPKRGCLEGYVHNAIAPLVGQIGSLVTLYYPETERDAEVREVANELALHVAAARPLFRDPQSLSRERQERLLEGFKAEARADLKPEALTPFLQSKLKSYYAENCLISQPHMLVPKNPVIGAYLKARSRELDVPIELGHFLRFKVGEIDA